MSQQALIFLSRLKKLSLRYKNFPLRPDDKSLSVEDVYANP